MSKILVSTAALALAAVLAVAAPAGAAERRADGVRSHDAMPTEFSSYHRRWHRRGFVARRAGWGPRYRWGVRRAYWGPRYAWGPGYGYWRPRYAYAGWGYPAYGYGYGYPYYWRPRPFFGIGFGFGRRWWW